MNVIITKNYWAGINILVTQSTIKNDIIIHIAILCTIHSVFNTTNSDNKFNLHNPFPCISEFTDRMGKGAISIAHSHAGTF